MDFNLIPKASRDLVTSLEIGADITEIQNSKVNNVTFKNLTSVQWSDAGKLKRLGDYAFYGCSSLTAIVIPEGVTHIGEYVFGNCFNIQDIAFPLSLEYIKGYAFANCNKLLEISILHGDLDCNVFANCKKLKKIVLPNGLNEIPLISNCTFLEEVIIPEGVSSICDEAFSGCISLTSISCPDSIINIGNGAFKNCTKLEHINLPANLSVINSEVFSGCDKLEQIILPETITNIENSAFKGCHSLHEIKIPESLSNIGDLAFSDCSNLEQIYLPENVTCLGNGVFSDCINLNEINIPVGIININDSLFYNCSSLENIELPDNLVSIGMGAFYNCSNLSEIKIPDEVISIGNSAFSECVKLKKIILPQNLTDIGGSTFYNCTSLTEISIPDNVSVLEEATFSCCTNLERVILPANLTHIKASSFFNCENLINISFPETLISIDDGAFSGCSNLEHINLPANVSQIGNSAFSNCNSLKDIVLSKTLNYIGNSAFWKCSNLREIIIPEGITRIEPYTFLECSNLEKIVLPSSLTFIGDGAFYMTMINEITIPKSVTEISNEDNIYETFNLNTIIRIYENSFAENWCIKNNRNYTLITEKMFFSQSVYTLNIGETLVPQLNLVPVNSSSKIVYTSSDPEVFKVENNIIIGVSDGTATLTASTIDGVTASCEVVIKKSATPILITALDGTVMTSDVLNETLIQNLPENATISLQSDYSLEEKTSLPITKSLTLNLNGYALNGYNSEKIISIENSDVVIKNGTIHGESVKCGIDIHGNANVVLENLTVDGNYNSALKIGDGSATQTHEAITNPHVIITSGRYIGISDAITVYNGHLEISGGTYSSPLEQVWCKGADSVAGTAAYYPVRDIALGLYTVDNTISPEFLGGSLRIQYEDNIAVSEKTSLRFGYSIGLSNAEVQSWGWHYGLNDSVKNYVAGTNKLDTEQGFISNLVITDIPKSYYDKALYSQFTMTYQTGDNVYCYTDEIQKRTVQDVAEAVRQNENESDLARDYANSLLETIND